MAARRQLRTVGIRGQGPPPPHIMVWIRKKSPVKDLALTLNDAGFNGKVFSEKWSLPYQIFFQMDITTSWGCWKHSFGIPGVRPIFLKPKLHKESKNGFKKINYRRSPVMIFSKNCFWSNKIIKKVARFVDFWIFMAICMDELDQF